MIIIVVAIVKEVNRLKVIFWMLFWKNKKSNNNQLKYEVMNKSKKLWSLRSLIFKNIKRMKRKTKWKDAKILNNNFNRNFNCYLKSISISVAKIIEKG